MPIQIADIPAIIKKIGSDDSFRNEVGLALRNDQYEIASSSPDETKQINSLYQAIVIKYGFLFGLFPEPRKTHEVCLAAVSSSNGNYEHLPEAEKSNLEILTATVEKGGINHLPMSLRSRALCEAAISYSKLHDLQYFPEEFFDPEIAENKIFIDTLNEAIDLFEQKKFPFSYLPNCKRDLKRSLEAVNRHFRNIFDVPLQLLNDPGFDTAKQQCSEALKDDPQLLKVVPHHLLSEQLCIEVLDKSEQVFSDIPKQFKTFNLVSRQVEQMMFEFYVFWDVISYKDKTVLTLAETKKILALAIKRELKFAKATPIDFYDVDLCNAVAEKIDANAEKARKNGGKFSAKEATDFLKFVNKLQGTIKLSSEEYKNLLIKLIKNANHEIFQEIPAAHLDLDVWLALAAADHNVLQYFTPEIAAQFSIENRREIYVNAATQDACAIKHIRVDELDFATCKALVNANGLTLKYLIPFAEKSKLDSEQFETVCKNAVGSNGNAIEFVPVAQRDFEVCTTAVAKNAEAICFIKRLKVDSLLTKSQLHSVAITALNKNPKLLKQIVDQFHDFQFLYDGVKQNGFIFRGIVECRDAGLLSNVSDAEYLLLKNAAFQQDHRLIEDGSIFHDYEHFMLAVKRFGMLLNNFYQSESFKALTLDQQREICIAAVNEDVKALEFVPVELKEDVINAVTIKKIIIEDYSAAKYLPNTSDYSLELENIRYVILTRPNSADREIRDSVKVYTSKENRKNQCIHCSAPEMAKELIEKVTKKNPAKEINLVLLGHSHRTVEDFVELNPKKIAELVAAFPEIHRVTFLGCWTADAKMFTHEIPLIDAQSWSHAYKPCGLILASVMPGPEKYQRLLEKMAFDQNAVRADEVYILVNEAKQNAVQLIHLRRDATDIQSKQFPVNERQVKEIAKYITKTGVIPFPKSTRPESQIDYYRGGKKSEFLSGDEIDKMLSVLQPEPYSRQHPNYANMKAKTPMLSSHEIKEDEIDKLKASFLLKVIEAMQQEKSLQHAVRLKGYSHLMHADIKTNSMRSVADNAYVSGYKISANRAKFWASEKDNIDRSEIKKYLNLKSVDQTKSPSTTHKSIKVTLTPKK